MEATWVAIFVLFAVFTVLVAWWRFARSRRMVDDWAAGNGCQIVRAERRWLRRGPFFFWTTEGQEVFRVTVRDAAGQVRSGYVRVGGFFLGLLSDKVQVRWDRQPDA